MSYQNFRLTLPTLLAWASAMSFHTACTMCGLRLLSPLFSRGAHGRSPHPTPPAHYSVRSFVQNFARVRHPLYSAAPRLPDVLHDALPDLSRWRVGAEIGHVLPVLLAGGLMLRAFDQRALDALRTFLWAHGTLMTLRGACFSTTLLPDASQTCSSSTYLGACHDLVFSGHVLIMSLGALTTVHFFRIPTAAQVALAVHCASVALFITAARNHYTLDVIVATVITPLVFYWWTTSSAGRRLAVLRLDDYTETRRALRPNVRTGTAPAADDAASVTPSTTDSDAQTSSSMLLPQNSNAAGEKTPA